MKINPGRADHVCHMKLKDGIPRLERTIPETGPFIPSDEEHQKVRAVEKRFGLMEEKLLAPMVNLPSGLKTRHGRIRYSTANDIAGVVKAYVEAILDGLGVADAEIHSEMAAFNRRRDLWVVSLGGTPVGVVVVKKPDVMGREKALEHPNVWGELYDFLRQLPNYYGVSPAFGILTNLNTWRMAWLPSHGDDVDSVAARAEGLDAAQCDAPGPVDGPEKDPMYVNTRVPCIIEEEEESIGEESQSFEDDSLDRVMHISRIFRKDELAVMLRAITSVLCKMIRSRIVPFPSPFANLESRTVLRFERGSSKALNWTTLRVKPQWHKMGRPKRYLFAIQDLGRGAHGRAWLTCTSSGGICVIKFPLDGDPQTIRDEHRMWQAAYPSLNTFVETWCGQSSLRMPYLAPVKVNERASKVELVRDTLTANFVKKKLIHRDVFWRNIGTYMDKGVERAVVFDMGSVQRARNVPYNWVEKACLELLRDSGGKEESPEYY